MSVLVRDIFVFGGMTAWGAGILKYLIWLSRPTWRIKPRAPRVIATRLTTDSDHRGLV